MKKLQKIDLVDIIGRELQSRMSFREIDAYFTEYGIPIDHTPSANSKWVYVKEVLAGVDDELIFEIGRELEINHPLVSSTPIVKDNEATFWRPGYFRLFLSHLSIHKVTVGRLKRSLDKYGISCFVAHEDIEPTKLWEKEIENGLFSMDALCAILMPGFKESNWTDQEVGVAIGRGILVIPVRKDLDPYGFIGKFQGFQANNKSIGEVAEGIFQIISSNPKTRSNYINKLTDIFLVSNSAEEGLIRIKTIREIKDFPEEKAKSIQTGIFENRNLESVKVLTELNSFLKQFNLPAINISDFNKKDTDDLDDDLPF